MGTFSVKLEIGDPDGLRFESVEAMVDSGATYTTAPASLLRSLGVTPLSKASFVLADGRRTEREIGQTWVQLEGGRYIVPIVFSEDDARPLLGAVTLEIFRLCIDPVKMRLIPVDGLLLRSDASTT